MNEDTLVVVHCYAGDKYRVENFLPYFLHHECPVLLLSPEDSPVEIKHPQITCRSAGKVGWDGKHTIERQIEHWRIVTEFPQKWVLLNDSDSMCLTPELPAYLYQDETAFWCNEIGWLTPHEGHGFPFHGLNFQPPYFLTIDTLRRMVEATEIPTSERKAKHELGDPYAYPFDWVETLRIDGLYTHMAEQLVLNHHSYPDGTNGLYPYTMELTANQGIRFFHGMKEPVDVEVMSKAYDLWLKRTYDENVVTVSLYDA